MTATGVHGTTINITGMTTLLAFDPTSQGFVYGWVNNATNPSIVSAGCTSGCGATYIYPDTWNVQVTLGPSAGGSGYLLFMWENLTSTMETETSIYVTTT